jgi:hypothetical protein
MDEIEIDANSEKFHRLAVVLSYSGECKKSHDPFNNCWETFTYKGELEGVEYEVVHRTTMPSTTSIHLVSVSSETFKVNFDDCFNPSGKRITSYVERGEVPDNLERILRNLNDIADHISLSVALCAPLSSNPPKN